MYINFRNDRFALGFLCSKEMKSSKKLSVKTTLNWSKKKGKDTLTVLFSKETLVAVFLFLKEPNYIPQTSPFFTSSQVYHQSCLIKSENLKSTFLSSDELTSDLILNLKGGSDEVRKVLKLIENWPGIDKKQKALLKSLFSKVPKSGYCKLSFNKSIRKILKLIEPVVTSRKFWEVLNEVQKLPGPPAPIDLPIELVGPLASSIARRVETSSSLFAEAFSNPRTFSPMQKRVLLKMAQNDFWNNLNSAGFSKNHTKLSKELQKIENNTRLRRTEPLYPSQVLGDSFKYGQGQLEKKALKHLSKDFKISTEGKTPAEMALMYKDQIEGILAKPNLIRYLNGTLNKQEHTINFGDPKSLIIVAFENNPLYKDYHFISGYPIIDDKFREFNLTGNIGMSRSERAAFNAQFKEKKPAPPLSFYANLPRDARVTNKDLREVESLQEQIKQNSNITLTQKQQTLIERANKYQEYKKKFSQDNPEIDKN